MGQILKEEAKNRILQAAKDEFLNMGFENASMRSIALKSDMTVGNLYRYFSNKDALHQFIVSRALSEINGLVEILTNQSLSLNQDAQDARFSKEQLHQMLMNLSDQLVDIYFRHEIEFNILMMQSRLRQQLIDWFENVIMLIIRNSYGDQYAQEATLLASMYAASIFIGVKTMFEKNKLPKDRLKAVLKIYFDNYSDMLNKDVRKIREETR